MPTPQEREQQRNLRRADKRKVYNDARWDAVRRAVFLRDLYRCQNPKCRRMVGIVPGDCHCDHIAPLEDGGEPFELDNLQTLCRECHGEKTRAEHRGEVWSMSEDVVVCGPPGAGKSTYVLANRQPGEFVWDFDALAATITGLPMHTCHSQGIALLEHLRRAVVQWLKATPGRPSAWMIVTKMGSARELAAMLGARLVVLDTPAEECERRLVAAGRQRDMAESRQGIAEWWEERGKIG